MTPTNTPQAPTRGAGSVPGELAGALRSHPWLIAGALATAWTVAAALWLVTPTQYEGDVTIHIGEVGMIESVRTPQGTLWRTQRVLIEDQGTLAARVLSRPDPPPASVFPAGVHGVRIENAGGRGMRVIVRGPSTEAVRSLLDAIAADAVADHARRMDEVRAVRESMRASLSARYRELMAAPGAGGSAAAAGQIAQLSALELQLVQAGSPPLTRPTTVAGPPEVAAEPVAPRTGRYFAVASVAGLFLGFALALFRRALRGVAS